MNITEMKAYQDKVKAQLQESKALLSGMEAHAKGKLAQAEIDAIHRLTAKREEIEKKVHHDLKPGAEVAIATKVKADIDAEVAKFKTSLEQLSAKVKAQLAA
jgi:hypothetical protein